MLNVEFIINNYLLGGALFMTPTHKITKKERINSKATKVIFKGLTNNELILCEKALRRKAKII